jgi:hypothetical protein
MVTGASVLAQESAVDENTIPSQLVFYQDDFGDRFAVLVEEDYEYNYFVTDLTKFPGKTERMIFLNLVFKDDMVISIDSDISKEQLWLKAPADRSPQDVTCHLDDLKTESETQAGLMNESEKAQWLEKNEKLNSK